MYIWSAWRLNNLIKLYPANLLNINNCDDISRWAELIGAMCLSGCSTVHLFMQNTNNNSFDIIIKYTDTGFVHMMTIIRLCLVTLPIQTLLYCISTYFKRASRALYAIWIYRHRIILLHYSVIEHRTYGNPPLHSHASGLYVGTLKIL